MNFVLRHVCRVGLDYLNLKDDSLSVSRGIQTCGVTDTLLFRDEEGGSHEMDFFLFVCFFVKVTQSEQDRNEIDYVTR